MIDPALLGGEPHEASAARIPAPEASWSARMTTRWASRRQDDPFEAGGGERRPDRQARAGGHDGEPGLDALAKPEHCPCAPIGASRTAPPRTVPIIMLRFRDSRLPD